MSNRKTIKQEDAKALLEKTAELIVYMRYIGWDRQLEGVMRTRTEDEPQADDHVDLGRTYEDLSALILRIREYWRPDPTR